MYNSIMELTHTHNAAHADTDAILTAFLEQGELPDIARRVNMSLAALANWASTHADLLANVHALLTTRCKLLAAQIELAALSALETVSAAATSSDDEKLRERALERRRKAASAILRHRCWLQRTGLQRTGLERTLCASTGPHAPANPAPAASHTSPSALSNADCPMPNAGPSTNAQWRMPNASSAKPTALELSPPYRLAARRLASLAVT